MLYRQNVLRKIAILNGLVCVVFLCLTLFVFFTFQNIQDVITNIFIHKTEKIQKNSELGRNLARVLSEANLVFSNFYGNQEGLEKDSVRLRRTVANVFDITNEDNEALFKPLEAYQNHIDVVITKCTAVNRQKADIEAALKALEQKLSELGDLISSLIFERIMKGWDASGLEQLNYMIPGFRESVLKSEILFLKHRLNFFRQSYQMHEHPIVGVLVLLKQKLKALSASEIRIAEYGKLLSDLVDECIQQLIDHHRIVGELDDALTGLEERRENILLLLNRIDENIVTTAQESTTLLRKNLNRSNKLIVIVFVFSLPFVIIAFLMSRFIKKVLTNIVDSLRNASDEVTGSSRNISSANKVLSQGATHQAADIEETSASLEQMSAMTRRNSENAGKASETVQRFGAIVEGTNHSMKRLTTAIEDIISASDETSQIVKNINDIAFKTNLLALNAAVEAARANEAGAGFAVVAGEVRNLAIRTAESANNTSVLIDRIVSKINEGFHIVNNTNQAFSEVAENIDDVIKQIDDITHASQEQRSGIEQINGAMSNIYKVTQQIVERIGQTANASDNMINQAELMENIVFELLKLTSPKRNWAYDGIELKDRSKTLKRNSLDDPLKKDSGNR